MRILAILLTPFLLMAGTEPRAEPSSYEAHAMLAQGDLGAEYLSRTVGTASTSAFIERYVAVEVCLFPSKGSHYAVAAGQFRLRINRAGRELSAQPAGLVASAIINPQYEKRSGLETGVGVGPADIVFGRPRRVERFPGDPDARRPGDNRSPSKEDDPHSPEADAKIVRDAALYEGVVSTPTAGVLYFAWPGKLKDIRSVELLYDGPAGKAVLKLK